MPRLNELYRGRAIGILQAGNTKEEVACVFGVTKQAIQRLWRRFNTYASMDMSKFKEKSISETHGSKGSNSEMGIVWK